MINWIKSYEFNSTIALYTYWLPLVICAVVYAYRFVKLYKRDLENCTLPYYNPKLTVGKVLWYTIVTVTPVLNMCYLLGDTLGAFLGWLFKALDRVFDQPLVRKRVDPRSKIV